MCISIHTFLFSSFMGSVCVALSIMQVQRMYNKKTKINRLLHCISTASNANRMNQNGVNGAEWFQNASKMALKWPKLAQDGTSQPRIAPEEPKMPPKRSQEGTLKWH